MLSGSVTEDLVLEFQARTAPAMITVVDVYDAEGDPDEDPGTQLPVAGGVVETVFLPLATDCFSPCRAS